MFLRGVGARVFCCHMLVLWAGLCGCLTAIAQQESALSIEIVAPRDPSGTAHLSEGESFEVRISNLSNRPVAVWTNECQLGYANLSFVARDAGGRKSVVQKRPMDASEWTEFPLKTVIIPSRGSHTLKVNLSEFFWGGRAWMNVPEPNTGEKMELAAIFEIAPTEEAARQHVWRGRVESAYQAVTITNPKLKTPQDYLWNAYPRQALRILKDDPAWIHKRDPENKCTPFHHAARFGYKKILELLTKYAANPPVVYQRDSRGIKNKLPGRIASGEFKLPVNIKPK
jgi:hypothetical protein